MNPITELLATLLDALSAARQAADLTARLKAWWYITRQPGIESARPYWPHHTALNPSLTRHNNPDNLRPQEVDIMDPLSFQAFPDASTTLNQTLQGRLE
jgi:hypothetical protein